MAWFHPLKSRAQWFVAVFLQKTVSRRTASVLSRLDDGLLADIGVPRSQIEEYAREVALKSVPMPPKPTPILKSILERIRAWRMRRAAIRELSALDDRVLRDIGIEPGQVGDVVDAVLKRRHDSSATHPAVQLADDMKDVFVPGRHRPRGSATRILGAHAPSGTDRHGPVSPSSPADVEALRARAANEPEHLERRLRAAGM